MADEEEGSEKPFEATPRKLEDARKRGEVPVSQDLITFSVYLGVLMAGAIAGYWSVNAAGLALTPFFAIAIADYVWQKSQFLKRQRMSLEELRDELKETDGDPHTKQARRQMAQDIATNRMLADVPTADVVVVNPEHYAVALKWARTKGSAPTCVAKGLDAVADKIREIAIENAVPIFRDPPTARALYASVETGDEIQVEHYQAIAAAIRFADAMRKKAKQGR